MPTPGGPGRGSGGFPQHLGREEVALSRVPSSPQGGRTQAGLKTHACGEWPTLDSRPVSCFCYLGNYGPLFLYFSSEKLTMYLFNCALYIHYYNVHAVF